MRRGTGRVAIAIRPMQRPVAIAHQEHRQTVAVRRRSIHSTLSLPHHQVDVAVAIDVCRRQALRSILHGVVWPQARKRPIALPQRDRHTSRRDPRYVVLAIVVKIRHHLSAQRRSRGPQRERSIPLPEQNAARRHDISFAVSIEIARQQRSTLPGRRHTHNRRPKPSIARRRQHGNRIGPQRSRNHDVPFAVTGHIVHRREKACRRVASSRIRCSQQHGRVRCPIRMHVDRVQHRGRKRDSGLQPLNDQLPNAFRILIANVHRHHERERRLRRGIRSRRVDRTDVKIVIDIRRRPHIRSVGRRPQQHRCLACYARNVVLASLRKDARCCRKPRQRVQLRSVVRRSRWCERPGKRPRVTGVCCQRQFRKTLARNAAVRLPQQNGSRNARHLRAEILCRAVQTRAVPRKLIVRRIQNPAQVNLQVDKLLGTRHDVTTGQGRYRPQRQQTDAHHPSGAKTTPQNTRTETNAG